jgi:hypothetical protein
MRSDFSEPHGYVLDKGGKEAVQTAFDQVRGYGRTTASRTGKPVSRVYGRQVRVLCEGNAPAWRPPKGTL